VSGRFYMKIIKRIRKKVFLNGMIFIEIIFWYFLTEKKVRQKNESEKLFSAPFYLQQNTRTLHAYFYIFIYFTDTKYAYFARIFCCRPKGARDV
jgi:hypothetical protein